MITLPDGPIEPGVGAPTGLAEASKPALVRLRSPRRDDAADVALACQDKTTREFLPEIPADYTKADALSWIDELCPSVRASGGVSLVIADPDTDRFLGSISLHPAGQGGRVMTVGYLVAGWARQRGVATAALRDVSAWAFQQAVRRLELTHVTTNVNSMRVAMAGGFSHEGVRRAGNVDRAGQPRDVAVWGRLATDPGEPMPRILPDLANGQLSDGVVTLTPLRAEDAPDMFALSQLPEVIATTVALSPPTLERCQKRCAEAGYRWLLGQEAQLVIRDAATGAFSGLISLHGEGITRQFMFGYDVTRESRGRGFAPRAVRLLTNWAFDEVHVARLVAGTAPDNLASQRVMQKAGFRQEGYERARLPVMGGSDRIDNVAWAMLPTDPRPPL